ncbi:hypothetical protein OO25_02535 [Phaeobacter sp. S60]|nr:hypothetical protein OO25_02535 [Phaeobacter sp. S60]
MLYELALPGLLLQGGYRWLRTAWRTTPREPALRLRSARARLRRAEIGLLDRTAPVLAASLLLRRFHRNQSEAPMAVIPQRADQTVCSGNCFRRHGVYLRQLGPVDGPRVLLIHGWNADGRMMMPLARALADQGLRVAVPDLPGTGKSEGRPRSFVALALILNKLFLNEKTYDLVIGHSAGGLIAMIALGQGLKAQRLMTISAPSSLARMMDLYLRFTGQPARTARALLGRYENVCGRPLAAIGPSECREMSIPLKVVHAKHDWQVPASEAQGICAAREGLTPIYLGNCNHRTVLHHPELTGLVVHFLQETSDREATHASYR